MGFRSHLHTSLHCTIPATSSSQPKELPLTKNKPKRTEKGARAQTVLKGKKTPKSNLTKKYEPFVSWNDKRYRQCCFVPQSIWNLAAVLPDSCLPDLNLTFAWNGRCLLVAFASTECSSGIGRPCFWIGIGRHVLLAGRRIPFAAIASSLAERYGCGDSLARTAG
jgi:hypothetical protein